MTAILAPPLRFRGVDSNGFALVAGLLNSYIAGTSTPQATYVDSTQTTQNTNPIILDARGECNLWLDPTKVYKFTLTDQFGNPIGTTDQVQGSLTAAALTQAMVGAALYPQTTAEIAASVTPIFYFYPALDVRRYGADPTGAGDSSAASANALLVAAVSGGKVVYPAGTFKESTKLQWTAANVYMEGASQQATTLSFSTATLDLVSIGDGVAHPVYCGVSRMTITSSVVKTVGAGLRVQNAAYVYLNDIVLDQNMSVGFQFDGGALQLFYFLDRFAINSGTFGIQIGSVGNVQELRIRSGVMNKQTGAGSCGINLINCSGVYISDVAASGVTGVLMNPGNGQVVKAAFFDKVICDTCTNNAWLVAPTGTGIVTSISLTACWGSSSQTAGNGTGFTTSASGGTIQGIALTNFIATNNQGGGMIFGAGTKISLVNCLVGDNSQGSVGTYHGAYFNISDWSVIGGSYGQNEAQFTNRQAYGIVADTACTNYQIIGVNVRGNITGGILDVPTVSSKAISKNLGYNPLPSTVIAVGASPFVYTNLTGDTVVVQVSGGTVSNVQFGNVAASATNTSVVLPNGQAVTVTYTAVPTMNYYGT